MAFHSGFSESDLHSCVCKMAKAQQKSPSGYPHDSTTAVYRKYGHSKYHAVAKHEPLQISLSPSTAASLL